MEVGFIPDASYDRVIQTCWHRGMPKSKKLLGMKRSNEALNYDVNEMIGIETFRCTGCGLLRSYARKSESTWAYYHKRSANILRTVMVMQKGPALADQGPMRPW